MTEAHRSRAYLKFSAAQRQRLIKQLPSVCPRCGLLIQPGDLVDLDHLVSVSERPDLLLDPSVVALAHRACNRRAGQRISARRRTRARDQGRLPDW